MFNRDLDLEKHLRIHSLVSAEGTVLRIRSFLISSILHTFVYVLPVHFQIAQRLCDIVKKVNASIKIMLSKIYSWISAKPDIDFPIYNNIFLLRTEESYV